MTKPVRVGRYLIVPIKHQVGTQEIEIFRIDDKTTKKPLKTPGGSVRLFMDVETAKSAIGRLPKKRKAAPKP